MRRTATIALPVALALAVGAAFVAAPAQASTALPVTAATASSHDGNVPANVIDGSLSTRWSALGDGSWIRLDLGASKQVGSVGIAWYNGNQRQATFTVQTSTDASSWTTVVSQRQSSGSTTSWRTTTSPTGRPATSASSATGTRPTTGTASPRRRSTAPTATVEAEATAPSPPTCST
ncbi:discoidin domain-containing protein [Verrucosispora sioxanthis]|uniref:discoidin domain-containing protein n=1 Tax=Verrucosispora sioxanthis TaxID=2499994 RepID=UPI002814F384|nr:discoidin domain-containing protein [Verrucosispora sioxanthis]